MKTRAKKDINWNIRPSSDGGFGFDAAQLAVLMDIRDELKTLNGILRCPNFLNIPKKLDAIRLNTTRRRKRK